MTEPLAVCGVIGMGVMGKNLALNLADRGFPVMVWNRRPGVAEAVAAESEGKLRGTSVLEELIKALQTPRKVLLMIPAGEPVDKMLEKLRPLLQPNDIVIDGGNSWYADTQRRMEELHGAGLRYVGLGISGGEAGARRGPSLMPGCDPEAYSHIAPMLEAISAKTESGPCVTLVGPGGAGHFVKMVHNGIEYADMQFLAEAYHLLKAVLGMDPPALADTFARWSSSPLESYLVEITARILRVVDPASGGWLIDKVLDEAGQKGTGRWTAQVALALGVPVPAIAAAIDARRLSSMREERITASKHLAGPGIRPQGANRVQTVSDVGDALLGAKIVAYAQGMALIQTASLAYDWNINLREVARVWKGGCIIRARLLDTLMAAYEHDAELRNLLLDEVLQDALQRTQAGWRAAVRLALEHGVPVPAMSAGLAYYDSYRSARLPQSLTQAQRDAFGAHTYLRNDVDAPEPVHTDWLG